jgi:multidrug efflux pump
MASAVATPLERQFGRIAGINQMTSTSQLGSTNIVLQFDLSRNIDGAARDVQAAINAARSQLPSYLPGNPTYRKVNPADAPIMIVALTSDTIPLPKIYDAADSILAQKLAQVDGVGQVFVGGGAKPAVRAEVNPMLLNKLGVGLDSVRTALNQANANAPKGELGDTANAWAIHDNDQIFLSDQYRKLIVAYKNGAPVRLADVADVQDGVEDIHVVGLANGKPAVVLVISRQPGANIIATVDRVYAALPQLQASISPAIAMSVVLDRTTTVRASVRDIELTLIISVVLVILVVFAFLRTLRATLIPSIAVPLSLIGTFGVMYLLGYSLDNLSLMALAISTGFVVDDRGAREHHALHRAGDAPRTGCVPRGSRNRIHRALNEHLAGCRFHSYFADGWYRRAAVPRIRRCAQHRHLRVAGDFTDLDAHDVCQVSAA